MGIQIGMACQYPLFCQAVGWVFVLLALVAVIALMLAIWRQHQDSD